MAYLLLTQHVCTPVRILLRAHRFCKSSIQMSQTKTRMFFFVAISVNDIGRLGIESDKSYLEGAVKQNGYHFGTVNSNRYFLKPDAKPDSFTAGKSPPKDKCRKMRCCCINKEYIDPKVIERIYEGLFNDTL